MTALRFVSALCVLATQLRCGSGRSTAGRLLPSEKDHKYAEGDNINVYASITGPFSIPSETYAYYKLPFCEPDSLQYQHQDLGETLAGDRKVNTLYNAAFKRNVEGQVLCTKVLNATQLEDFRQAVASEYYFKMYLDDVPIWGFVGREAKYVGTNERRYFLFAHLHFDIWYNESSIIEINVSADPNRAVDTTEPGTGMKVEFTYSVKWHPTSKSFQKRMEKFNAQKHMPHHLQRHWYAIVHSSILVVLLLGVHFTIFLRSRKRGFAYENISDVESGKDAEDTGSRCTPGAVFTAPKHLNLLCAIAGCGCQLLAMAFSFFAMVLSGTFPPTGCGPVLTAAVCLYALTAGVSGFVSGYFYKMFGGTAWIRNVQLTASIFMGPMACTFAVLNTIAASYGSTQALPLRTIVGLVLFWTLVALPLTILGSVLAKNCKVAFDPCQRTTMCPHETCALPWYKGTLPQMVVAGFLPFSAMYIELGYVFWSVWGQKSYLIPSVLFALFCLLLVTTAAITAFVTYFQLARGDRRWWWRSTLCSGSTGLFVFGYSIYHHLVRYIHQRGFTSFMQISRYYGYSAMICYALFLMLASVGLMTSLSFVTLVYRSIESDAPFSKGWQVLVAAAGPAEEGLLSKVTEQSAAGSGAPSGVCIVPATVTKFMRTDGDAVASRVTVGDPGMLVISGGAASSQ